MLWYKISEWKDVGRHSHQWLEHLLSYVNTCTLFIGAGLKRLHTNAQENCLTTWSSHKQDTTISHLSCSALWQASRIQYHIACIQESGIYDSGYVCPSHLRSSRSHDVALFSCTLHIVEALTLSGIYFVNNTDTLFNMSFYLIIKWKLS